MQTAKERIRPLLDKDLKVSEIAKLVGVTTQRVYQILDELRDEEANAEVAS